MKAFRWIILFSLLTVVRIWGAGEIAAAPKVPWQAGLGRAIITPPAGLWMTGYASRERPALGVAQELWTKVLVVADPAGQRLLLITLDLCGISREATDRMAAEIQRKHRLGRGAVLFNVSHTHCSPWLPETVRGIRLLAPEDRARSERYAAEMEQKVLAAVDRALADLAPAELMWGEDLASFGMNRRENPEAEAATLRATGRVRGPFDPRVPVLAVRNLQGELRAVFISYACHNTTLNFDQWHGDYAGCAQAELERRFPGTTALFAIGCGADINPLPRRTVELAERFGRELADAAERALRRPMNRIEGRATFGLEDLPLTFSRIPTEEQLREAREKDQPYKAMHQAWAAAIAADLRTKGNAILNYAYPIQVWRLGGLAWVALGGEVVVDYSLRLRSESKEPLWVFGYSNDVMAYIPSERVLREGGYEGDTSMVPHGRPSPWTPGLEEKIVTKVHEMLARARPN